MATKLRWLSSSAASALHAAAFLARGGKPVDPRIDAALEGALADLQATLSLTPQPERLLETLAALAHGVPSDRELAEVALRKAIGPIEGVESIRSDLQRNLMSLRHAFRRGLPDADSELALRTRPLREQWEARGPGLLKAIGQQTEPDLIAEAAEVAVVWPIGGGLGAAHLGLGSVRIEGVLANPVPRLPEVVRLGWLLSQLRLSTPIYSETIRGDRVPRLAGLAMVGPTLAAAALVELVEPDSATIPAALAAWLGEPDPDGSVARAVGDWWTTYQAASPPFSVALAALDAMVG